LNRVNERRLSGELATRDQALQWVGAYLSPEAGELNTEDIGRISAPEPNDHQPPTTN
jgi:hypothetical protein